MKTMSAMAIFKMKTIEVMKGVKTDREDYPVADAYVKLLDGDVKVGVITHEDGCVLLCDDFGCSPGSVNAYWFDQDEELEIGLTAPVECLTDETIDQILEET